MRLLCVSRLQSLCGRHSVKSCSQKALKLVHAQYCYGVHGRGVTTLSPLAAAFNSKRQRKINLSLHRNDAGLFLIPELQDYAGFYLLQHQVSAQVELLVQEATSRYRTRKMVTIFDELSDCLCRVADMADFVRVAHPDRKFAEAAEDTCVKLSSLVERLNTNTAIHSALKKVLDEGDVVEMDAVDRRVSELFMFDFEQSGIHLDRKKRQRFVELNESILMLGSYFQNGTQKGTSVPKENLPENLRHVFALDGNKVMVTGLFSDHFSDTVREAAYRIFLYPDPHQEELLSAMLSARHQLANLVGFDTYSHRANRGTMMESPDSVMAFLDLLSEKLKPRVEKELGEILRFKQEQAPTSKIVHAWDPPYYSALSRQKRCSVHTNEIMAYLSLGSIMSGLDGLFSSLYGVSLHTVEMQPGEAWHYDVHKLAVEHESEGTLGYIYCDFFERPGKPHQDCHFTIRGGRQREDGGYQLPIVVLQLHLPSPSGSSPTLLSPGMMENLFHEFGHAMHSMLGRTKYQHVTGTRCPTDFAEIPSVLMEFFASDPRVISSFARHYKTGEPLKESVVQDMCAAKNLFASSDMQQQTFYSALDQMYHGKHPLPAASTTALLADVQSKYSSIPYVSNTAWQLRFGHLVGYGARYYAYLISRAVAARLWHTCFRDDPFNRNMGQRYREEMLQHGGGIHPTQLVEGMLGEKISVENLVDSLIHDLDSSQESLYS
ncbi:mitochondrial intermediate peptidase-like [Littorina saxatilis]|uniref:Peptidase M3A/M3B catalytic domain-containing protein n=1 Tax=Littorina saxatilis TaxID=31220 RepID=A0AAN9APX3_9CAEN